MIIKHPPKSCNSLGVFLCSYTSRNPRPGSAMRRGPSPLPAPEPASPPSPPALSSAAGGPAGEGGAQEPGGTGGSTGARGWGRTGRGQKQDPHVGCVSQHRQAARTAGTDPPSGLESEVPEQVSQAGPPRPLSLACERPPSPCPHLAIPLYVCVLLSSCKNTSQTGSGPTLVVSF